MQKLGLLRYIRFRWFLDHNRQVLRNRLSAEDSFSLMDLHQIKENDVFPTMVMAHTNNELIHKFIRKFPEIYLHKGVLEWSDSLVSDVYGTPGIYIRNVFNVVPFGVYQGYNDPNHGQVLFIPMYINVTSE